METENWETPTARAGDAWYHKQRTNTKEPIFSEAEKGRLNIGRKHPHKYGKQLC